MEDGDIFSGSVLNQNYFFDFNLFMSDTVGTGSSSVGLLRRMSIAFFLTPDCQLLFYIAISLCQAGPLRCRRGIRQSQGRGYNKHKKKPPRVLEVASFIIFNNL